MQQINMAIKAVLSEVKSANMPINGGEISKPILDIHVAKVIPLVAFILGNWPIKDIVSGNITDIPNPMREKPNIVKIIE